MPTIQANELQSFAEELFVAAKVPAEEARIVAGSLVGSNLRGHDSHGVMRIPYYVQFVREGRIHPGASLETLSETPAALACDGGWGFGQVQVPRMAGTPCPPGWLLDPEGRPTTDPNQLYVDPPGSILPMGGDQAYKGFGLALTIDMLAGGLSGGWCSRPNPEPPLGNDAL